MPSFVITAPDGKDYNIDAPEGATQDQALAYFQQNWKAPQSPKTRSWGDVPLEALANLPSSVGGVLKGVAEAVTSPVQTAKGLYNVGKGAIQNATGLGSDQEAQQAASAVGDFYKQRYGSEDGFKEALATDPAGVLADASTVLTGGAGLAAKVPLLAKGAAVAGKVGASIDPMVAALRAGKGAVNAGGALTKQVLGATTGVGAEAIGEAYRAGKQGNKSFTENMRGNVPMTDVLDTAKADLDAMRKAKNDEYRSGMIDIAGDKEILDFAGIDKALQDGFNSVTFKGQIKNKKGVDAVSEVQAMVDEWKALDKAEYHTPEGLDALKQKIGAVKESLPMEEKTAQKVVGDIYNAVKKEIELQTPAYAKVMKDYSMASDQISEIERSLLGGQKGSVDSAMRKLQSLMRNNVNTNYGNRLNLAKALEQAGGQEIMPALAGQAMSNWMPRGLQGATLLPSALMSGGYSIPAQMPRVVGEATHVAGKLAGALRNPSRFVPDFVAQSQIGQQIGSAANTAGQKISPFVNNVADRIDPRILANALYQSNQIGNKQ